MAYLFTIINNYQSIIFPLLHSSWRTFPSLAYARMDHAAAWAPELGFILVVGGTALSSPKKVEGMYRDWRNPLPDEEQQWVEMEDTPFNTDPCSMTFFRGHFFIAGGYVMRYASSLAFAFKPPTRECYEEGDRGQWCRIKHLQQPRRFHDLVGTRNMIFGFGEFFACVSKKAYLKKRELRGDCGLKLVTHTGDQKRAHFGVNVIG